MVNRRCYTKSEQVCENKAVPSPGITHSKQFSFTNLLVLSMLQIIECSC